MLIITYQGNFFYVKKETNVFLKGNIIMSSGSNRTITWDKNWDMEPKIVCN